MQKQPTREKAVAQARTLLKATCEEYNLNAGKLVYHNDKVQYIGEVNLQVSLVYDQTDYGKANAAAIPPANGKGRWG